MSLHAKLSRLARQKPELRKHLVPLLQKHAAPQRQGAFRLDRRRYLKILHLAARQVKDPETRSWLEKDERGTWEKKIGELLEQGTQTMEEKGLGLTEDQVNKEIATAISYQALSAVARSRKATDGMALRRIEKGHEASQQMVILTDDDWDEFEETADPKAQRAWKGYLVSETYSTWDEEALEIGDTDDKGWEFQDNHYDYLEEVIDNVESDASWLEWSDSSPGPRSWITSDGDQDFRTGERTYKDLFIRRGDKKPLSREEIKFISQALRL